MSIADCEVSTAFVSGKLKTMVFSRVSTRTLAKTALFGAVGIIGSLIWARTTIENRVRNAEFYRLAMKELRASPGEAEMNNWKPYIFLQYNNELPGAVKMLGAPITEHGFDVGDNEKNHVDRMKARLQVSVKGPTDKGYMFFWAEKPEESAPWLIKRMELALKRTPDKLLLIKKDCD